MRSAAAANIQQVVCTQGSASLWSPRVLRAGMGAHFSLNIYENVQLEDILEKFEIPVFVTSSHQSESIYQQDLTQPCAWILGNEGQGASAYALQHAKAVVIPQPWSRIIERCSCRLYLFLKWFASGSKRLNYFNKGLIVVKIL